MTTYRCGNCDFTTEDENALEEIEHFSERHVPGDVVADGQCPDCGCLCFKVDEDVDVSDFDTTRKLFLESLAAWDGEEDSVIEEHRPLIERMRAHAKAQGWLE
jgi:hypothetical protein